MNRRVLAGLSALSLAAGLLTMTVPVASAAEATCPAGSDFTSVGTVSGSVSGLAAGDEAAVYVVDTESGDIACVVTQNGAYSAPLPGVTEGSTTRKPADAWLIVANPPASTSLASASRLLPSMFVSGVSPVIPGQNLSLSASNLSVSPKTVDGGPVQTPVVVCLYAHGEQTIPTTCAVSQGYANSDVPVARLTVPATGTFYATGSSAVDGAWSDGMYDGELVAGSPSSVEIYLGGAQEVTCEPGTLPLTGQVRRGSADDSVPVRAMVEVFASWFEEFNRSEGLGYAESGRDGSFTLCADVSRLPGSVPLQEVSVRMLTNPITPGPAVTQSLGAACLDGGCTQDVLIPTQPSMRGSVTFADGSPAPFVQWSISQVVMMGQESVPGPQVAYGNANSSGGWGVEGLAPGETYLLRVYSNERGFAMKTMQVAFDGNEVVNVVLPEANLVGRVINPDGSPASFTWIEAVDYSSCNNSGCSKRSEGSTDDSGYFSLLLENGNYHVSAYPNDRTLTAPPTTATVVGGSLSLWNDAAVSGTPEIELKGPNVIFAVSRLLPEGGSESLADSRVDLERWSPDDPNQPYSSFGGSSTGDDGRAETYLEPGTYRISANAPYGVAAPRLVTYAKAVASGDSVTLEQCPAPADWSADPCSGATSPFPEATGAWQLVLPLPDLLGTVTTPSGAPVPNTWFSLNRWNPTGGGGYGQWDYVADLNSTSTGEYAAALPTDGRYRIDLRKPDWVAEDWVDTAYYFLKSGDNICALAHQDAETCAGESTPAPVEVDLAFGTPNVSGVVVGVGGQPVPFAWINVSAACDDFPGCERGFGGASTDASGRFNLNLPEDDTYTLRVYPWRATDGSVTTTFSLRVDVGQRYVDEDSLTLNLRGANVTGVVKTADDTLAADAWVSVQRQESTPWGTQWQWVDANATADQDGEFGLALDPGTYRLRVEPGWRWKSVAVAKVQDDSFTVSADPNFSLQGVVVRLGRPNVTGVVTLPAEAGGGAAPNSWIEVQRWSSSYSQYVYDENVSGANTDQAGTFGLDLPDGRWQLVANPPPGSTEASRATYRIVVVSGVAYEETDGGGQGAALNPGEAIIVLGVPNISGTLQAPNGEPVGNTWIDVRKWNDRNQNYEWSPELQGINVSYDGSFAATLLDGSYRLIAQPPYGDTALSRGSVDLWVTGGGNVVCRTGSDPCGADDLVDPGQLVLELRSPNVTGTVTVSSSDPSPVSFTGVGVEKWNGTYWQWVDLWTNTNGDGEFALNVTEAGAYRLTASPTPGQPSSSPGVAYFYAEQGQGQGPIGLCPVNSADQAESATACFDVNENGAEQVVVSIALAEANLIGEVFSDSGPVSGGWVEIRERVGTGFTWIGGTSLSQQGRFALTLDAAPNDTEYRLVVHPPWGSTDLTRKSVDVIACYVFMGPAIVKPGNDCDTGQPVTSDDPLAITLGAGNVRGSLMTPLGEGVSQSYVEVEKWTEDQWRPGRYTWQWADINANTHAEGSFSLSITEAGIYRVTGNPPWDDAGELSKGSSVIRVGPDAGQDGYLWCEVDDTSASTQDPFDPCSPGPSVLTVTLQEPNVSTIVRTADDTPVRNAWVSVRQKVTVDAGNGNTFETWEWRGGSSTRAGGVFSTVIDDSGTYALEVNPPWDGSAGLPRFTEEFTVNCDVSGCTTSGLDDSIAFPEPNVQGVVLGPESPGAPIANSWVSVEKWDLNRNFQWVDMGSATDRQGRLILALTEDGTYRLTANPPWDNPVGVRTSIEVQVSSGEATCTQGCPSPTDFTIQLQAPNVTGVLVDSTLGDDSAMAYSWVEVRDAGGDWVTGTGTDGQGRFALNVPPGDYTVWGYPNWNFSQKPPKSIAVTVPASGVEIDLGAFTPNFTLIVIGITSTRMVSVERCTDSSCTIREVLGEYTQRTKDVGGVHLASFDLPAGWYAFSVLPEPGESLLSTDSGPVDVGQVVEATITVGP